MNILAISAHPDDIEINCAGTLAACVARGDNVTMCNVSNGDLGHVEILPEELAKIRLEESRKSAALLGAEHVCIGAHDLHVYDDDRTRAKLADVIRGVKPDLIIAHTPDDYMVDHVAASRLAFSASFCASLPHYKMSAEGVADICPIYYMDNLGGFAFEPTEYVDITAHMELKMKMLRCHASQLDWMREHDGIDFSETVRAFSRTRGLQCGAQYAEGFRPFLGWGRMRTYRLLP
ncbi:MAG TPA: PIG-L family deacetylase [Candidatus Borkfalkia avicola]|uniref:PIG-L family deacetylase n=1 Tax=Candidatus Borkfalkia avicola TaxID=2838503 RepID=A0A9D2D6F3_9FIRM|nr:PIG-L family deacetylase [Candidatus Borkfalkia avicola]